MSNNVDTRVVSMRFDNEDFEKKCSESIKTLDNLKESLHLEEACKSFSELGKSAASVSFEVIFNAAAEIGSRFSAGTVIAITAIQRLTNAAIDAGTKIVKSLSIDQVAAGWEKYSLKISSVQTIFNAVKDDAKSAEENLGYVNEQIEKLNWFTDETSFNLIDMTSNIAKFTSAGVELPRAVQAMMGIASAAGYSGLSIEKASHAMEGFSKAMAQGYMSNINWSWIKTSGLDTIAFKQQMIDAAEAAGKLEKKQREVNGLIEDYYVITGTDYEVSAEDFQTNLKGKWLTSDVMEDVLNQYGSFASEAYDIIEDINNVTGGYLLTSDLNNFLSDYATNLAKGLDYADEAFKNQAESAGLSKEQIEKLLPYIQTLSADEYKLSREAFAASQEAKTFAEAIDSIKDAASTKWMQIFETVLGDYLQAKNIWTELANWGWDAFVGPIDNLVSVFKEWGDLGGRDDIVEFLESLGDTLSSIMAPFHSITDELFPRWNLLTDGSTDSIKILSESLKSLTERFNTFSKSLGFTEWGTDEDGNPVRILEELTPAGKKVEKVIRSLSKSLRKIKDVFADSFDAALSLIKSIEITDGDVDNLVSSIEGLGNGITFFYSIINSAIKAISDSGILDYIFKGTLDFLGFLGNNITKITENSNYTSKLYNSIKNTCERLKGILDKLKPVLDVVSSILDSIFGVFDIASDSLKETNAFGDITDTITNFLERLATSIYDFVKDPKKLESFGNILSSILQSTSSIASQIFNNIDANTVVSIIESIGNAIGLIIDLTAQLYSAISDSGIVGVLISDINSVINLITGSINSLSDGDKNVNNFYDIFKSIADTILNIYTSLRNIVISVWNLVAPIVENILEKLFSLLTGNETNINSVSDFFSSLGTLFNTFNDIFSNLKIDEKIEKFLSNFSSNLASIAGILASIGLVYYLVKRVFGIVKNVLNIVSNASGIVKGIKKAVENIGDVFDSIGKAFEASAILIYIYSFYLIAKAISMLGNMSTGQLTKGFLAAVGCIAILIVLIEYCKKIENTDFNQIESFSKSSLKVAAALVLFSYSIKIMSDAVSKLSAGQIIGIVFLLASFVAIVYAMYEISKLTKNYEKSFKRFSRICIIIAASLVVYAVAIKIMASATKNISLGSFGAIIGLLTMFLVVISVMIAIVDLVDIKKIGFLGLFAIEVSASLLIFAAAVKIIASATKNISIYSFAAIIGLLAMFLVVIAAIVAIADFADIKKIALIGPLSLAISASLLIFAVAVSIMSLATKNMSLSSFGAILGLLAMYLLVIMSMALIASIGNAKTIDKVSAFAIAISSALLIFSLAIAAMAAVTKSMSLGQLASIASFLLAFVGIVALLALIQEVGKRVNFKNIGVALILAATAVAILAASLFLLSKTDPDKLTAGMLALVAVMLGLVLALVALALVGTFLSSGLTVLSVVLFSLAAIFISVGLAVVLFGAGLLLTAHAIELLGEDSEIIVKVLNSLAEGLKALSNVGLSTVVVILALGAASILLGAGIILAAIGIALVVVVLSLCAEQLHLVTAEVLLFITAIISLSDQAIPLLKMAGVLLAVGMAGLVLGAAMVACGIGAIFLGTGVLIAASGLEKLGYSLAVVSLGIEIISEAATSLADVGFGNLIASFSGLALGLKEIQGPINKMYDKFGEMGEGLSGMAEAASIISSIDSDFSSKAEAAGNALVEFSKSYIKSADLFSESGVDSEEFAKSIKELGEAFGYTKTEMNELTENGGIQAQANEITDIFSGIGSNSGDGLLSGLKDKFTDFDLSSILDTSSIATSFGSIGSDSGSNFLSGLTNSLNLSSDGENGFDVSSIMTGITGSLEDYEIAGTNSGNSFAKGLDLSKLTVSTSSSEVSSKGALAMSSDDYVTAGENAATGFAIGLKNKLEAVSEAGTAIGKAALEAAKKVLEINSPSKKMFSLGNYTGEGFALGLNNMCGTVKRSGENIANTALDSVSNAIQKVSESMSSDFNNDLTIRPIVDMSDVRSGASELRSLFGWTPSSSYEMAMSASSDKYEKETLNQNGTSEPTSVVNITVTQPTEAWTEYLFNKFNVRFGGIVKN